MVNGSHRFDAVRYLLSLIEVIWWSRDHGSRFFENGGQGGSLAGRLLDYMESWSITHLAADATGVGEGLVDWLAVRLGRHRVTPFKFTRTSKAALGSAFLALVETGRFKYWIDDKDHIGSDGWWFWQQAAHCIYELPSGGLLERNLRWYVPPSARISTPTGSQLVHDDRLLSAALIAEIDRLLKEGKIALGRAESAITQHYDPLNHLPDW